VATVLAELAPLEGQRLADLAAARQRSTARRLGWLLTFLDAEVNLEPLRAVAEPRLGDRPALARTTTRSDRPRMERAYQHRGRARPVIPEDYVTHWSTGAPWPSELQIEQDLVSRA
jgi:nucleotide-binding universal stress UspA family protein